MGCGAAIGAVARYALVTLDPAGLWTTVCINVLGCFLMGWRRPTAFWGTGVLGGFTTFSAYELAVMTLPLATAASVAMATVVGCLCAWVLGDTLQRPTSAKEAA
ncbi:camphor resistance protein CrcB [Corynebacterium kalinowskii]|uniref:Fluoride-specific ion channel FluC n=1 Tax=Corynebacterium kalinowskii TaxID=2675216 RepID=A0A6B8VNJ3_9CORY|nr:camphor resistance protein CrcB [Corynebacterium kalinowskii]